jgi:hypothetical protein
MSEVFVAVYTNKVKRYCDQLFFDALNKNISSDHIHVIDNSNDNGEYMNDLKARIQCNYIAHLDISEQPEITKFHRKVAESVTHLRTMFLLSQYKYFLIAESDVILNNDKTIEILLQNIKELPEDTGAVGALYYDGFHNYSLTGIQQTNHVLSGCTIYKRAMIERFPFRYDPNYLPSFPDAIICVDAINDFKYYNNHELKCSHAHSENGSRYI